jgi:TonB-dependent receptor
MRKHYFTLILFFSIIIILMIGSVSWAEASTAIEGYVTDAKTGEPLPGANVFIVGTSLGAASDMNGKYIIPKVPPGSFTLRVTYIGYKTMDVTVQVSAEEKIKQDFELDYVAVKGEEVVVTAQAEGQMAAINQQLSSRSIVNVVSSDRIQELPDANAAESVGRLPGVSVLREGGEGQKVVIRGLSPKYNAVMIEGVRMAATDFDDRSADLSMISPYMLEGIEVMKAITPDQDADILGGSVNFKIKEAREGLGEGGRLGYDFIARGGYNGLKNTYDDYKFVVNLSTRLYNSRLGILAQADIEKRNRSSQEMGADYRLKGPELDKKNPVYIGGLNLNDIIRERQRYGGTFVLDYRLPAGKINLKNFFSFSDTKVADRNESYNLEGITHEYAATDTRSKLNVMTNVLNYEQNFSLMKIDAKLSHTVSENKAPDNLTFNFEEMSALAGVNDKVHPTKLPDFAKNIMAETDLRDINEFDKESKDRELAAAANFEMTYRLSRQISGKVKFGGKYRYKDRSYDHNWFGGPINLGSGVVTRNAILNAFPWMKETVPDGSINLLYSLFIDPKYDPGTFLKGDYDLGPTPDIGLMYDVMDIIREVQEEETYARHEVTSNTDDYSGNEYLSAGYIMTDLNIGQAIKIIPGVRYEHMKTSYTGCRGNSSFSGSKQSYRHHDTTMVQINDYWLPMAHVRYKPFPWFDVRFAYTNTLSRPDFRYIIPRYNIGLTSVSWHNYKLKPSRSENFDLYFSAHENHIGLFTLGGFIKRIDDLIYDTKIQIIDPAEYELGPETQNLEMNTQINNPNRADLWGIEVDWQTHFWYLPGFLRGLVFNANYTHIFSETKYPRTVVEVRYEFNPYRMVKEYIYSFYTARLLHQPDDIVNTSIGYDYKDFSVRLSMLYQSNIFKEANFWPELREITDDYLRWDLSIKQDLPWYGLQLYCNVNNLTSTLDRDMNQGSLFPAAEQHYGRTVDIGLRWIR